MNGIFKNLILINKTLVFAYWTDQIDNIRESVGASVN